MNFQEISERFYFAEELHKNKKLSDMIQRSLKKSRGKEIAAYIDDQKERFFNSLVAGIYEGHPKWHGLAEYNNEYVENDVKDMIEEDVETLGFLELEGNEKIFTIDGQHRLAGIKQALSAEVKKHDRIPVIFVAHENTKEGFERTRRLFTTLNKTAKPVNKKDIIALDEDDTMAIITRRLVEEPKLFPEKCIDFIGTANIYRNNVESFTTIIKLYDVIEELFVHSEFDLKKKSAELKNRPSDSDLDKYFNYAKKYFKYLTTYFSEINEYMNANKNIENIVRKYRGDHGGSILFRPLGIEVFTIAIANLTRQGLSIEEAVKQSAKLPTDLRKEPYVNLFWSPEQKKIISDNKILLRDVLIYMLNGQIKRSDEKLLSDYREKTEQPNIELPKKIA